ncbi:hypothetical protein GXB85_13795, partial [Cellulomonas sp. APG4]|uniref:RHS repeat-associated core domain-containing protein n=1 Tax=Cellulomonas sp. APG4 TaxID=1538656 RepID=UPI00137AFF19
KERATDTTGLLLMGARLYNPTTGLFTSVDPVVGGNTTAYAYPQDPINQYDLDGRWSAWKAIKKAARAAWSASGAASRWLTNSRWGRRIGAACSLAWGAIGAVCGGVYAAAYARQGRWKEAAIQVASAAVGGVATKGLRAIATRARPAYSRALVARGTATRRQLRRYDRITSRTANIYGTAVSYRSNEYMNRRYRR